MKGILLNDDFNLLVKNGTLAVGDITAQNQKILLLADKGELKFNVMRGVGTRRYLESSSFDALAREIRTEFSADGMKVEQIKISKEGIIEVNANYGTN